MIDNNTAARCVKVAMKSSNSRVFRVVHWAQQADGTDGAQTPMDAGCSYLPLDDILPPPAEDIIENIREKLDHDGEMWRPNLRIFHTTKTGFQKFEQKLQKKIIRRQRYLAVIRNHALGLFANYEPSVVADEDVAWLHTHDHFVNPPAAGSVATRKRTSSCQAAN